MAAAITLPGNGNAAFAYAFLALWAVLIARRIRGDRVPSKVLPAIGIGAA